ncbi:hypothetical protein DL768_003475 [Monosporascus sp. mg162]|nr:hypothetical protein DL768_003475 [Monosporascus sp. mg162]
MDEVAQFTYLKDLPLYEREVPYRNFIDGACNIILDQPPPQPVQDIRGREKEFTLATQGFEYREHALPAVVDWQDKGEIEEIYVEALKSFVQDLIPENVQRCEMFDFRLRSAEASRSDIPLHPDLSGTYKMPPAMTVHVDQSPLGVLEWLRRQFGQEETNQIVNKYRVRVINIWRPLVDVVEDLPLAMCDSRTVKPSDLVHSAHASADNVRRTYLVKYNKDFRFYYLSRMTKNEVCAFTVFDSAEFGGDSIRTPPHAAFHLSNPWSPDRRPRESIEVRLLVLSEPEPGS